MEFKDIDYKLYSIVKSERNLVKVRNNPMLAWRDYIDFKDMGISHIGHYKEYDLYEITDEKKWTLNKIKYGI